MLYSFKPTTLALAVSLICSAATAQEFDISSPTSNQNILAGIYNPAADFAEDISIKAQQVANTATSIYGYNDTTGNDRNINGNLNIDITDVNHDPKVWALRLQNASKLNVNGDTAIAVKTDTALAVGVLVYQGGSSLDLSNSATTVNVSSDTGRVMGIDVEQGGQVILGKTTVNLNVGATNAGGDTLGTRTVFSSRFDSC